MSCEKFSESFVLDYLRNKTQDRDVAEFRTHVEACSDCRTRLEELESLLATMAKLGEATHVEPAPEMKGRLMAQAREIFAREATPERRPPRVFTVFHSALRYAAAAAVILALWWVIETMRGFTPEDHVVIASISDVTGPLRIERAPQNRGAEAHCLCRGDMLIVGEEPVMFTYNNAFRVRLDPKSTLLVDSDKEAKGGVLNLKRGKMRADGCQCNKEMRVLTCCGTVESVGGAFTLKADPEGNVHLAVHRGSARVHCRHCGTVSQELGAGESAPLSKAVSGCRGTMGTEKTEDSKCGCGR